MPGTNVKIEKGTVVNITIKGVHDDPENYMDPHKFDPDRFSAERKADIKPYSYLPFGDGPKVCIGKSF